MSYKYFDTPDGEDCHKKLYYLVRKGGLTGLFIGSSYVLCIKTPPTYKQILAKIVYITAPFVAAAVTGGVTVCTLVNLREKDDSLNHVYGGFLAGVAGGLAASRPGYGICIGFLMGVAFGTYKNAKLRNYNLMLQEDFKMDVDDFWTKDADYRVTKPRPKEWIAK